MSTPTRPTTFAVIRRPGDVVPRLFAVSPGADVLVVPCSPPQSGGEIVNVHYRRVREIPMQVGTVVDWVLLAFVPRDVEEFIELERRFAPFNRWPEERPSAEPV